MTLLMRDQENIEKGIRQGIQQGMRHAGVSPTMYGYREFGLFLTEMAYVIYGSLRDSIFCRQAGIGDARVMLTDNFFFF